MCMHGGYHASLVVVPPRGCERTHGLMYVPTDPSYRPTCCCCCGTLGTIVVGLRTFRGSRLWSCLRVYILHYCSRGSGSRASVPDSICGSTPVLPISSFTGAPASTTDLFSGSEATSEQYFKVHVQRFSFQGFSSLVALSSFVGASYKAVDSSSRSIERDGAATGAAGSTTSTEQDVFSVYGTSSNN